MLGYVWFLLGGGCVVVIYVCWKLVVCYVGGVCFWVVVGYYVDFCLVWIGVRWLDWFVGVFLVCVVCLGVVGVCGLFGIGLVLWCGGVGMGFWLL